MGDSAVPMFVQHTEAMLDVIHRTEKLEIKDVDEEPVIDIDSLDKKDPLRVVEYIDDLYTYCRAAEVSVCVPPNYMAQQTHISERMRRFLIDWLIIEFMKELTKQNIMIALKVHYKFKLMEEILYLTVNLVDRFLAVQEKKKLQLVGVTAMFIACKYKEVCFLVMDDFIQISEKAFRAKEILNMVGFLSTSTMMSWYEDDVMSVGDSLSVKWFLQEKLMFNTLQFKLSVPTLYVFMRRFLKAIQSHREVRSSITSE
ncbi:cyclin-B2-3-like [Cucurbita maxima]|uniref:B-like cyclin n=1 Tax=Cucurbita maxima TaxID=3661 RepID=A0A6J1IGS6_CUCMA|nr:cyclin-B2-3-like [Cucurbita maxima]